MEIYSTSDTGISLRVSHLKIQRMLRPAHRYAGRHINMPPGMNRYIDVPTRHEPAYRWPVGISMCRSAYALDFKWDYSDIWDILESPTGNGIKRRACPLSRPPKVPTMVCRLSIHRARSYQELIRFVVC